MVSVQWKEHPQHRHPGFHRGGGVLIAKDKVLTAAHVVARPDPEFPEPTPADYQVRLDTRLRTAGGVVATVDEIDFHPQWPAGGHWQGARHGVDLAILHLQDPVEAVPAPLVHTPGKRRARRLVLGWGVRPEQTATPDQSGNYAELQQQDLRASGGLLAKLLKLPVRPDHHTYGVWPGMRTGASGGPILVQDKDGGWAVESILSNGPLSLGPLADQPLPALATSIVAHSDWIHTITAAETAREP